MNETIIDWVNEIQRYAKALELFGTETHEIGISIRAGIWWATIRFGSSCYETFGDGPETAMDKLRSQLRESVQKRSDAAMEALG